MPNVMSDNDLVLASSIKDNIELSLGTALKNVRINVNKKNKIADISSTLYKLTRKCANIEAKTSKINNYLNSIEKKKLSAKNIPSYLEKHSIVMASISENKKEIATIISRVEPNWGKGSKISCLVNASRSLSNTLSNNYDRCLSVLANLANAEVSSRFNSPLCDSIKKSISKIFIGAKLDKQINMVDIDTNNNIIYANVLPIKDIKMEDNSILTHPVYLVSFVLPDDKIAITLTDKFDRPSLMPKTYLVASLKEAHKVLTPLAQRYGLLINKNQKINKKDKV